MADQNLFKLVAERWSLAVPNPPGTAGAAAHTHVRYRFVLPLLPLPVGRALRLFFILGQQEHNNESGRRQKFIQIPHKDESSRILPVSPL